MSRSFHQRCLQWALLIAAPFVVSGCLTVSVWGGEVAEDDDGSSHLTFTGGEPLSDSVWVKIIATPFALAFDICTSPIQAFLYGWGDDDDDDDDWISISGDGRRGDDNGSSGGGDPPGRSNEPREAPRPTKAIAR